MTHLLKSDDHSNVVKLIYAVGINTEVLYGVTKAQKNLYAE